MHGGDDREGQVPDGRDPARGGLLEFQEVAHPEAGDDVELVEVEPGAERPVPGPGQDQGAQPAVTQGAGGDAVLVKYGHGLGVHPVRPVDAQDGDAAVERLDRQRVQLGQVHRRVPLVSGR
jgi:hypothetical protein